MCLLDSPLKNKTATEMEHQLQACWHIKYQPFLNVNIQIKLTMMACSSQSTAADPVRPSNNRMILMLALKWRLFCDEEPVELGARP